MRKLKEKNIFSSPAFSRCWNISSILVWVRKSFVLLHQPYAFFFFGNSQKVWLGLFQALWDCSSRVFVPLLRHRLLSFNRLDSMNKNSTTTSTWLSLHLSYKSEGKKKKIKGKSFFCLFVNPLFPDDDLSLLSWV